ncbi:MAG TPA: SPOR domain-containing protein [Tepidisphaeraceae bacterium]|jgi:tetratricopeptide (TPR) repeat protein
MLKVQNGFWRAVCIAGGAGALILAGCSSGPSTREQLGTAYKELESPNPNYVEIASDADAYLKENPTGPAAADALYLRGRALEEKGQRDAASPQKDFADAYDVYNQALSQKPRPGLEGLIHVGMGNVLYFQDRYSAAINELATGLDKLERDSDKAWTLYRVALCYQRMGSWDDADKGFATVQQQYPNTPQAERAREHQGARGFYVQVGTYASPAMADAATMDLKKLGYPAQRFQDNARNVQYVRVGPINSYESAVATRQKVWGRYRDSVIVP